MTTLTKKWWLPALVVLLLVANTVSLVLLWVKPHPKPMRPHEKPFEFLVRELGFDNAQQEHYRLLVQEHREESGRIKANVKREKEELYKLMKQVSVTDSMLTNHTNRIAGEISQLELVTYRHFEKVRMLCKPTQQVKFDQVIQQVLEMMGPRHGPPPGDIPKP